MFKIRYGTIATIFALVLAPIIAVAGEPELDSEISADTPWTFSTLQTKKGEALGHTLIAASVNGRGAGFRCFDGNLIAAVALQPGDVMAAFTAHGRQKPVRVYVSIKDAEPEIQDWLLIVRHRVIVTANHKITRALYNAIVLRETITIDPRRHGDGKHEYVMPTPDPAAFSEFMNACEFSANRR